MGRSNVVMPRAAGSVVQCGGSRNVGSRAGNAIGKGNRDQQTGADSASELRVSCGDDSGVVIVVMVGGSPQGQPPRCHGNGLPIFFFPPSHTAANGFPFLSITAVTKEFSLRCH